MIFPSLGLSGFFVDFLNTVHKPLFSQAYININIGNKQSTENDATKIAALLCLIIFLTRFLFVLCLF